MTKKSVIISLVAAIVVLTILVGAVSTQASSRTTRTLKEQTASDIKYNDEKINVYFFWGNGCQHCEALISYLNTLPEEYDNYFDLYTLEVWYNEDNSKLMAELGDYLEQEINGVPCLIIGDQVFIGFREENKEAIKDAIKKEYNKKERYDAYKNYKEQV